ncbi:hypothetical protein CN964_14275 [Bacillus cereus]|nr:hypothetical protein COJ80_04455 [Bacillus cereus]PGN73715.1 hypothetical protein CN964_14275 [Bacillus cereus]
MNYSAENFWGEGLRNSRGLKRMIAFFYAIFYSLSSNQMRKKNAFKSTFLLMHKSFIEMNVRRNFEESF